MRVVQLITHMKELGGAQVHVRDLSRKLVEDGHTVTIFSGGKPPIDKKLWSREITYMHSKYLIRNINIVKDFLAFLDIRKKLKRLNPDIVAIHSSKAGIIGRLACYSLRMPFVFTAHGWAFTEGVGKKQQVIYRFMERMMGKISPKIIAVSYYDSKLAITQRVLPLEKIETIHNGVRDQQLCVSRLEGRLPTIVMVARFEKPKKQLELIEALANLKELPWKMVFVGEGSLRSYAIDLVVQQKLEERVSFLDSHTDIHQVLSYADIFVLTSSWEGLPLSILEAMLHGLPILASDVGGVPEIVRDRDNGFLLHGDLEGKLQLLIADELLRKKMGKRSREIYEEEFTFDHMYQKTISLYSKLKKSGEKT